MRAGARGGARRLREPLLPRDDPVERLADDRGIRGEAQTHPVVAVRGVEVSTRGERDVRLGEQARAPLARVEAARGDVGVDVERTVGRGDLVPAELVEPGEDKLTRN